MILFQSTKNLLIKGLSYLLISLFICSCSPTLYVLDKNPQLAGRIYKITSLAKVDERLKNNPNDLEALILNVESLTTYAFGFLIEESDRMMLENYSKANNLELQAHNYFAEAVQYGDSALSYIDHNFYKWFISNNGSEIVDILEIGQKEEYFRLFYWTAAAYGGAISSSGGDPKWIIKLPRVGKLLNSIVSVDSSWNNGAALTALISFTMNNPLLAPNEADSISKNLFQKAIQVSGGKDMGPYLTYAESVSKTRQKKDEFISLLNQALNIDIKSSKEFQLTNTISKNRAEWLLDNIDEFFY